LEEDIAISTLRLDYLDLREFLLKFFDVQFNILSIFSVLLQLTLIAWFIYMIFTKFRGTQAERVLRGLLLITPLILVCYLFKLSILTKLIEIFSPTILIGLIVIFAPEFRRVLMQLGGEFSDLSIRIPDSRKQITKSILEIVDAVQEFKKNKIGALIIIEQAKVDRFYINPGQRIDANLSKEMLLAIFSPKSPLHDGAVTVRGSVIQSAGVILPMTENPKLDWQYGTRHRAAIGFSEVTDSLCIVVSEETSDISVANQGRLVKLDNSEALKKQIELLYANFYKNKKKENLLAKYFSELKEKSKNHKDN
jgi:diadenylate cyclase